MFHALSYLAQCDKMPKCLNVQDWSWWLLALKFKRHHFIQPGNYLPNVSDGSPIRYYMPYWQKLLSNTYVITITKSWLWAENHKWIQAHLAQKKTPRETLQQLVSQDGQEPEAGNAGSKLDVALHARIDVISGENGKGGWFSLRLSSQRTPRFWSSWSKHSPSCWPSRN